MGKFSGVLLATDYDDTLYDSKGTISPENRAAIDRFLAEGGLFSISTGRSYINFVIQMEREKLPVNAPVILSNGASIYDFAKEESLWLKFLPKRAPVHIAKLCAAFPELGFEAYHQDEVYAFRPNVITYRHLTRCRLRGPPAGHRGHAHALAEGDLTAPGHCGPPAGPGVSAQPLVGHL